MTRTQAREVLPLSLLGKRLAVVDIETVETADTCRYCREQVPKGCEKFGQCTSLDGVHVRLGYESYLELGLSLGCYWDYADMQYHWFDRASLTQTVQYFMEYAYLLVGFNSSRFDFPLLIELLRGDLATLQNNLASPKDAILYSAALYQGMNKLAVSSYDLLAECRFATKDHPQPRGATTLEALRAANGMAPKPATGSMAPLLFKQGQYAAAIEANLSDVQATRALFEMALRGEPILRGDGVRMRLVPPDLEGY